MPTLSATITGFVNGDTMSVVSGSPSLTTTATTTSPVGGYPVSAGVGTLSASNYVFSNMVGGTLTVIAAAASEGANFNGQGASQQAVFRPSTDQWIIRSSNGGAQVVQFGDSKAGDLPVPADYQGIGKTDLAVYRPSTGQWFIRLSDGATEVLQFGDSKQGDIPVPGDYDGDGKTDLAVFRPASDQWIIRLSNGGTEVLQFGDASQGDIPGPGDYEGTGKLDLAVFRPATDQWIIRLSNGSTEVVQFGDPSHGDIPAPGDYNGDGKTEPAVYRPSTGQWMIDGPAGTQVSQFGDPSQGDLAVEAPLASLGLITPDAVKAMSVTPAVSSPSPAVAAAPAAQDVWSTALDDLSNDLAGFFGRKHLRS